MKSVPCKLTNGRIQIAPISLARFAEANEGKTCDIVVRESKRSSRQNRALRLYCRLVAEALNDAGLPLKVVLQKKMDMDWTGDMVLEIMWRDAQRRILKKESTKQLNKTGEIDVIYDHINRYLGEYFSIHVPFPHFENEQDYVKATGL